MNHREKKEDYFQTLASQKHPRKEREKEKETENSEKKNTLLPLTQLFIMLKDGREGK